MLSGQRRSHGRHRCVTPLYRISMWIFDGVLWIPRKDAKEQKSKKAKKQSFFKPDYRVKVKPPENPVALKPVTPQGLEPWTY